MKVADVGGVSIAGVLFDAGQVNSSTLLTVGTAGNKTSHKDNPITLCDTFYRVGGADETPGKATTCVIINSSDVIGDNFSSSNLVCRLLLEKKKKNQAAGSDNTQRKKRAEA